MSHEIDFTEISTPGIATRSLCSCPLSSCVLGPDYRADLIYFTEMDDGDQIQTIAFEETRAVIDILEFIANGIPQEARDSITDLKCGDPLQTVKSITGYGYLTTDKVNVTMQSRTMSIQSIDGNYNIKLLNNNIEFITLHVNSETRVQVWDYIEFTGGNLSGRVYKIGSVDPDNNTFKLIGMESTLASAGDGVKLWRFYAPIPWSRLENHQHYQAEAVLSQSVNNPNTQVIHLVDSAGIRVGDTGYIDREWVRVTKTFPSHIIHVDRGYAGTTATVHAVGSVLVIDTGKCFNDYHDTDGFGNGWGHVCLKNQDTYYTRPDDPGNPCTNTTCPDYDHDHAKIRRVPRHIHEMTGRYLYRRKLEVDMYASGPNCDQPTLVHQAISERDGPSLAGLYGDPLLGLEMVMGIPTAEQASGGNYYKITFPHSGAYVVTRSFAKDGIANGLFIRKFTDINDAQTYENGRVYEILGSDPSRAFMTNANDPNYKTGTMTGWEEPSGTAINFQVSGELRNHIPTHGEPAQGVWDGGWIDL